MIYELLSFLSPGVFLPVGFTLPDDVFDQYLPLHVRRVCDQGTDAEGRAAGYTQGGQETHPTENSTYSIQLPYI